MAKKKIELFIEIKSEREFEHLLDNYRNTLICIEVFCHFSGSCSVLDHIFTKLKLDWSDGKIILLKVPADEIKAFERFRDQSKPVFLFILNKKITKIFRGVHNFWFPEVAKQELEYWKRHLAGVVLDRPLFNLDEASPDEQEWRRIRESDIMQEQAHAEYRRIVRQAARKRHRAEVMAPELEQLNFVLFWPHAKHAHPELYERWDLNGIIMIGREEIELTPEMAEDVLYAGDAPQNEASMHALLSGAALAICFRLLDTDKNFVELVRKILYEDPVDLNEENPERKHQTAFNMYKSYSLTKQEVLRQRKEEKLKRKAEIVEIRARRLSEMQRLAKQAIEEAIEAKKAAKEKRKLELLKKGDLDALEVLKKEPENYKDLELTIPEELPEDLEPESSEEDNEEDEYFPPAGLLVPGFYAPPNDIAKANGLAVLFPNHVLHYVTPEAEYLPAHVLVMLDISKRHHAIGQIKKRAKDILHMGIFRGYSPETAVHIAYSVKQFDKMKLTPAGNLSIAFMVAMISDFALLELMDLNPLYVSRDFTSGEEDCAQLFSVDYADDYPEFEDF